MVAVRAAMKDVIWAVLSVVVMDAMKAVVKVEHLVAYLVDLKA